MNLNQPAPFGTQHLKIDTPETNPIQIPAIQLERHTTIQGISVTAPHYYQIGEVARLIVSGATLEIDNVDKFFAIDENSSEQLKVGCLYQVSLPLPSYESTTILVRLHNKEPAINRYDLDPDERFNDKTPTLTFRIGNRFGVFIVSADNEIIDFTTDVSQIEVIHV